MRGKAKHEASVSPGTAGIMVGTARQTPQREDRAPGQQNLVLLRLEEGLGPNVGKPRASF